MCVRARARARARAQARARPRLVFDAACRQVVLADALTLHHACFHVRAQLRRRHSHPLDSQTQHPVINQKLRHYSLHQKQRGYCTLNIYQAVQ